MTLSRKRNTRSSGMDFKKINGEFDHFFVSNESKCEEYRNITKSLYDQVQEKCKTNFDSKFQAKLQKAETMNSLVVKSFDNEQIWQQLELYNKPFLKNIVSEVASFTNKQAFVTLNLDFGTQKPAKEKEDKPVNGSKRNTKVVFEDESDEEDEDFDDEDEEEEVPKKGAKNKKDDKKSKKDNKRKVNNEKVDFFDLKEMEAFLDAEDAKEMDDNDDKDKDKDDDEEDDEGIDYFADMPSDDEEDEEVEDDMYDDFFDPPPKKDAKKKKTVEFKGHGEEDDDDDDDDNEEEEDEEIDGLDTRDFDGEDFEDEEQEDEEEELDLQKVVAQDSDSDDEETEVHNRLRNLAAQNFGDDSEDDLEGKSEFEKSQILLKRKIEKAQRELLQPAALNWKLAGEAISDARPENSLLEEHLDFDHISRPAPVITDDTTKTLEGLIKQRIKDKAFDDVERKQKPKEVPFEFRRRLMLESEKSKVGLAEVYEKEFMKKKAEEEAKGKEAGSGAFVAAGEAEESEKSAANSSNDEITLRKLDALSSFHFTPRAPEADVKIINNMPAISVEEATPDMGSGKSLVAPEEVFSTRTKKVLQAPGERDQTDRKRARRIKKKKQGVKRVMDEKKHGVSANAANKAEIMKLKKGDKQADKDGNNGMLKKSFTSSGKFFERLQETKDSQMVEKKRKKPAPEANLAKRLKLN